MLLHAVNSVQDTPKLLYKVGVKLEGRASKQVQTPSDEPGSNTFKLGFARLAVTFLIAVGFASTECFGFLVARSRNIK